MPASADQLIFSLKEITGHTKISDEAFVISFIRDFEFTPGQCVALKLHNGEDYRIYSIASGAHHASVNILYTVNPSGSLTPRLSQLKPGDKILVSNPFGNFFTPGGETWWIAAGTGIAPFMSMACSGLADNKTLLQGAPVIDRFYFSNQLDTKLNTYIRCCSRENHVGCYPGRVTTWLTEQTELPPGISYMICGSAEFVIDVRDILIEKGVRYDKIIAEIYF